MNIPIDAVVAHLSTFLRAAREQVEAEETARTMDQLHAEWLARFAFPMSPQAMRKALKVLEERGDVRRFKRHKRHTPGPDYIVWRNESDRAATAEADRSYRIKCALDEVMPEDHPAFRVDLLPYMERLARDPAAREAFLAVVAKVDASVAPVPKTQ